MTPLRDGTPRASAPRHVDAKDRVRRAFEDEALALADHVYRAARSLAGSRAEAEELTQETYAQAFRSWQAFTHETDLRTRLVCILTSLERDSRHLSGELRPGVVGDHALYDRLEEADGEAGVAVERLTRHGGREALAAVPHEERDALVIVDVGGFSHADAARILGVPLDVLLDRVQRGRRMLGRRSAAAIRACA